MPPTKRKHIIPPRMRESPRIRAIRMRQQRNLSSDDEDEENEQDKEEKEEQDDDRSNDIVASTKNVGPRNKLPPYRPPRAPPSNHNTIRNSVSLQNQFHREETTSNINSDNNEDDDDMGDCPESIQSVEETQENIMSPDLLRAATTQSSSDRGSISSSTQKPKRAGNYTIAEDVIITKAYASVTEDPIVGNNQKGKDFWDKVHSKYILLIHKSNNISIVRPKNSIQQRYRKVIAPAVQIFNH